MQPILLIKNKNPSKNVFYFHFQKSLTTSANDLQEKIKYNQHIIKLIKIVKKFSNPIGEKSKKEIVGNIDLNLCFSYLYQNVDIQSRDIEVKKKQFFNSNYSKIDLARTADFTDNFFEFSPRYKRNSATNNNEQVVIHKNAMNLQKVRKVYDIIMQSAHLLAPKDFLMLLYNLFLFQMWNYRYLEMISTNILNNIYNFKTSEYLLIQLFFVFFEKKENTATTTTNNNNIEVYLKLLISSITKGHTTQILNYYTINENEKQETQKNVRNEIFPLVKELTKYGNHMFYKRRKDLLLNEIKELLFIYQSYDQYIANQQLLEYILLTLEKNVKEIDVEALISSLANKKNECEILKKFNSILSCYYYFSCIKSATIDEHTFANFYRFVSYNNLTKSMTLNQLFLLLQICERSRNGRKEKTLASLLHYIHSKLKLIKLMKEGCKIEKEKTQKDQNSLSEYVPLEKETLAKKELESRLYFFNYMYSLYEKLEYEKQKSNLLYSTKKRINKKNRHVENNVYKQWKCGIKRTSKGPNTPGENVNYVLNAGNEHADNNRIKNISEKNRMGDGDGDGDGDKDGKNMDLSFSLTFFDDINNYIERNPVHNRYIEILICTFLKNETGCEKMLLHFLNDLNKTKNINVLLLYVHLVSQHFNNIYILFYVEYFYYYIFESKFKNFSAEKPILLLSSLYILISYKKFLKDISRNTWEKNSERFLLLLYQNNMPLYTYVTSKLLNLNQNITNFDELLFHMFFKNMINRTFSCLIQNLPYIHDSSMLKKSLYYFLRIYYNYCYQYFHDTKLSLIKEVATIFFLRMFHVQFLHMNKMKDHSECSQLTKEILQFVHLDKEVDQPFINCIMCVYFQNRFDYFKREENPFVCLKDVFQKLLQMDCHLKYENGFIVLEEKKNGDTLQLLKDKKQVNKNVFFQKEEDLYAVHLLLLIQLKVHFNNLFIQIKELLYSYTK